MVLEAFTDAYGIATFEDDYLYADDLVYVFLFDVYD